MGTATGTGGETGPDSATGQSDEDTGGSTGQSNDDSGAETTSGIDGSCSSEIDPSATGCTDGGRHPECSAQVERILDQESAALYRFIGRFTRGDSAAYRGSSTVDMTSTSDLESHAEGMTIASLAREERYFTFTPRGFEQRLMLFFPNEQLKVHIAQPEADLSTTEIRSPLSYGGIGGLQATCSDCVEDLSLMPAMLIIDLLVSGYSEANDFTFDIDASGMLERVDPLDLSFDEIRTFAYANSIEFLDALDGWEEVGGEMRLHREDEVRVQVPATPGNETCHETTRYTVEWFVDIECPARHGVANATPTETLLCCLSEKHGVGEICQPI